MSILDQLLPPDPNSEVRPSSTGPPPDIRSQPKAPKINRNVPILEQLQPQHTSAMSMKAAEQLEQFKLQAKLKEEKRKQLRMDEEQRRRERDGQRATGGADSRSEISGHRPVQNSGGSRDISREPHREGHRDHSHDSHGDHSSAGATPGNTSSPSHSYVLTHEGAMLRRKEQERRMRELAKDVDLTSQMELMANFEASF
ncbi:hypothetical protein Y032_0121g1016 [Ancylostoma ceylanicum]|uniref:Bromodomain protein 4 C-terminal domain-containing protein n=1 Tax=Ancylostoma ceylanicum TaxID=53326 RepID=A0A016TAB0_9BILA|nr:hypothetical protein Y032_0121g1016 [Ancylostoma ceylanicum]